MDTRAVHDDFERARATFRTLLEGAAGGELRRRSGGTRWTNRQLLFHMLLGFLIMRALLALTKIVARLPRWVGRGWARLLNAGTKPFDAVNFAGSWLGGSMMPRSAMVVLCDHAIAALHRRLDRENDSSLAVQHFDFHREQLSLS